MEYNHIFLGDDCNKQPPFYSRDVSEMYDAILHKPLHLPPGKSEATCHLLYGLLQKDQRRRIGAIADFVSDHLEVFVIVKLFIRLCVTVNVSTVVVLQLEIKNHVFFAPINWDDLYHKRITPPYNPNVVGSYKLPLVLWSLLGTKDY